MFDAEGEPLASANHSSVSTPHTADLVSESTAPSRETPQTAEIKEDPKFPSSSTSFWAASDQPRTVPPPQFSSSCEFQFGGVCLSRLATLVLRISPYIPSVISSDPESRSPIMSDFSNSISANPSNALGSRRPTSVLQG